MKPVHAGRRRHLTILAAVLLFGTIVRLLAFPHVPPGLNRDEVSAGYEAYSLMLTGKDRWGNVWPAYFPSWGSGQNILYSYLSIPFIRLLGFNAGGVRAVGVLIGLLTLPLLYLTVRTVYGRKIALIATAALAILPWHVMASRWSLESNLLPFFLLLGLYAFLVAVKRPAFAPLAFLPWALALYAYGLAVLVLPFLVAFLVVRYRKRIAPHGLAWGVGLLLGLVVAAPFLAFFAKNSLHVGAVGDHLMGMSIPQLPTSRISQDGRSLPLRVGANLNLLVSGFNDGQIWNSTVHGPMLMTLFPFLAVALLKPGRKALRDPFVLWLIACFPVFLALSLNVNRANAALLPIGVLSAVGLRTLQRRLGSFAPTLSKATYAWVLASAFVFFAYYFGPYRRVAGAEFNVGLTDAIDQARKIARPDEPVLVSPSVRLAYLYVLMHDRVAPADFQRTGPHDTVNGVTVVEKVDGVYFWPDRLPKSAAECLVIEPVAEGGKPPAEDLSRTKGWSVRRQAVGSFAPASVTTEP